MDKLILVFALFFSTSVFAYRGPYLPTDQELQAPPVGTVVFQAGFGEDIDLYNADQFYDETLEEVFYFLIGEVIVQFSDGTFEVREYRYKCSLIDDGAYGAISCDSATYLRAFVRSYNYCEYGPRRDQGYYCY